MTLTLPLSETFGRVWQGEGWAAGRVCSFVRLGRCNLSCEWCDTPFTWDETRYDVDAECPETDVAHITARLTELGAPLTILSGGEPLIHQAKPAFAELLAHPTSWHVETNGTIAPNDRTADRVEFFNVSPKINTRDPEKKRIKPRALARFAELARDGRAGFKFVCSTPEDVDVAAALADAHNLPAAAVWIMPEGQETGPLLDHARAIADTVARYSFNLTLRQHVLLYGTERGR